MYTRRCCRFARLACTTAFALGAFVARGQQPMREEADAAAEKFARIAAAVEAESPTNAAPLETTITEREINSYFELEGPTFLPEGIATPRFTLGDGGRVRTRAIVDLDVWGSGRERSVFDPLSYLAGDVEVIATGRLEASDGEGVIRYESATVAGLSVPKTLAQELVRFYTRSEEFPNGIAFDTPYPLPAGVRAVSVQSGEVAITQ
jgi:hypothetical protein